MVFDDVVHLAYGCGFLAAWVAAVSIASGYGSAHGWCGGIACDFVVGGGIHVVVLACLIGDVVGGGAKQCGYTGTGIRGDEQWGVGNVVGAVAI